MLKKKDWKELLQEFSDKVDKREKLIKGKIDDLQEQEQIIQTKIKDNSDQMIELEMNEDTGGVEKFKKENRTLRDELEEIKDAISGYENQLGTSHDHYARDLDKIRVAANKAEEERIQRDQDTRSRRDGLEAKIDELKKQIEQINHELRFSRTTVEDLRWQLSHIDRRASKLPFHEQENFIKRWLADGDTESFFNKKETPSGRNVVHVDTRQGDSEWVSYPTPYQF